MPSHYKCVVMYLSAVTLPSVCSFLFSYYSAVFGTFLDTACCIKDLGVSFIKLCGESTLNVCVQMNEKMYVQLKKYSEL